MNLKKAMRYYLECLDAVTVDKLSDLLDIKQAQAQKIITMGIRHTVQRRV